MKPSVFLAGIPEVKHSQARATLISGTDCQDLPPLACLQAPDLALPLLFLNLPSLQMIHEDPYKY